MPPVGEGEMQWEQRQSAQWDFIVALYAKPNVRDTCLALQDEGNVDIPVLLAALYATTRQNFELCLSDIQDMDVLVEPLRTAYVLPLRAMRTALKGAVSQAAGSHLKALRDKILEAELLAEREQLALLNRYFCGRQPGPSRATIDDTLKLVCDFYFRRSSIGGETSQKAVKGLGVFSKALFSMT